MPPNFDKITYEYFINTNVFYFNDMLCLQFVIQISYKPGKRKAQEIAFEWNSKWIFDEFVCK